MKYFKIKLLLLPLLLVLSYGFCEIKLRNTLNVLANANDQLLLDHELMPLSKLTDTLKVMIPNKEDDPTLPERRYKEVPYFGKVKISSAIVSIACDRGTSYNFYIKVQNEVERAYNELRNELALAHFKTAYDQLEEKKKKAINMIYPKRISEAEPRQINASH